MMGKSISELLADASARLGELYMTALDDLCAQAIIPASRTSAKIEILDFGNHHKFVTIDGMMFGEVWIEWDGAKALIKSRRVTSKWGGVA